MEGVNALINEAGLESAALKTLLRDVVAAQWPGVPVWSALTTPLIEEVQKANLGA